MAETEATSTGADRGDGGGRGHGQDDTEPATLYERLGGLAGVHRLVTSWYATVLDDPLLGPLFGGGAPGHVPHLTAFLVEVFGGPADYTDELGGFPALLAAHRGKRIGEEQRQRFIELFLQAADTTGVPADARTRDALRSYLEFGTQVAVQNSHATTAADWHPCQEVPRWSW